MTKRALPEWIGKTPDTAIPPRVRLRVFDVYDGKCHKSGVKIRIGMKWQIDHIVALANGGENRESNLAPILDGPHKEKTRADVKQKAKTERIRKKFLGIGTDKPKRRLTRKFNGTVIDNETGQPYKRGSK